MSDLTRAYFYQCQSIIHWDVKIVGSKGTQYTISCFRDEYSCTCKGFTYRGHCRHVEAARDKFCGWLQFFDHREPVMKDGSPTCPDCGLPVETRPWMI